MSKIAFLGTIVLAAWGADQHYGDGYFADGLLTMLTQIRHSFGW
jgi:hypothetical protein